MIIGYARVSTDGQTLEGQQAELRSAGAERVYSEKISGAITDRPALARAINVLGNGDVLIVTKLDRLARSTRDLLNTLAAIGDKGAAFKSLGDSWADTTTPAGKLILTVLGGLAEYERHLILARTSEGRKRAQQRGVAAPVLRIARTVFAVRAGLTAPARTRGAVRGADHRPLAAVAGAVGPADHRWGRFRVFECSAPDAPHGQT